MSNMYDIDLNAKLQGHVKICINVNVKFQRQTLNS